MTKIVTDEDLDRAVTARLASEIPLPPDVVLNSSPDYHALKLRMALLGVDSDSVVKSLLRSRLDAGMAVAAGSAQYVDRLAHITASYGLAAVPVIDLRFLDWAGLRGRDPVPQAGADPQGARP